MPFSSVSPSPMPQSVGASAPVMSPTMIQYCELKQTYQDCLLFFRMGDFYELFFEDAVMAAQALDIVLTKRGKTEGEDIPMCGVPAHTHDIYLAKLVQKGFKVAICEQLEDPQEAKKRGSKGPLRRDVVRVVTPGTLTEDSLLDARQNNFLTALSPLTSKAIGVASIDLSTGVFLIEEASLQTLGAVLSRVKPSEILLPDPLMEHAELADLFQPIKRTLSPLPLARFDFDNGQRRLEHLYGVSALDAFGQWTPAEIKAAGALVDYIYLTQKTALRLLDRPRKIRPSSFMTIDPATRKSLELDITQSGQKKGSLLSNIDLTITAAGGRLLSLRLSSPLRDPQAIHQRLDTVEFFASHAEIRSAIRSQLKSTPDMERALSRLNLGRGSPRDLGAVRDALKTGEFLVQILQHFDLPASILHDLKGIGQQSLLIDRLERALAELLLPHTRDGNFIACGYNETLDMYRQLRDDSESLVSGLQDDYCQKTGISSLKIKHNQMIGYYIEIPQAHASKMTPEFTHRQTLASAIRYSTPELSDLAKRIESAAQQALALELELFQELRDAICEKASELIQCSRVIANIDVMTALAELAVKRGYTRPLIDDSLTFTIKKARHPVIESALHQSSGTSFVPNDCLLEDPCRVVLMTGPNMAGKSTYLRQNALVVILAQMGSFVPAEVAHIGVVDRIFSRVGASDDLAAGRSTFMVEMVETAAILNQATEKSFVILDEIGRGTATYDGLSLAWAIMESLCQKLRCRTLFATHYHELTKLSAELPELRCQTMKIKEWEGKIIFLHEVIEGQADRSYGIHVASMAGIPQDVIKRAEEVLHNLEEKARSMMSHNN